MNASQPYLPSELLPPGARDEVGHLERLDRAERRRVEKRAAKEARRQGGVVTAEVIQIEISGAVRERFRALVHDAMAMRPPASRREVLQAIFEVGIQAVEDLRAQQATLAPAPDALVRIAPAGTLVALHRQRSAGARLGGQ